MAVEKVGVYRKWLEPVPERNGKPIPRPEWPKKRRHRWVVRWCSTNNKKYGKVFRTRKEAQNYASGLQGSVNLGKADKPQKITLQQFRLEHMEIMKGQVSYGTLQEHKRALELFENFIGGSLVLSKIQPRHAEAFIANRLASQEVSVATVNKYIRNLRSIFNRAITPRDYLAEGQNPFARIKQRKVTENPKRYVKVSEYRALMDTAREWWWKTFLSIAYGSGLRRNEILHLTWMDVEFDNQRINVSAKKATSELLGWEPKNRKNRVVPMSDETAQLLVNMQVKAPEGHPYIFVSPQRLERILERRNTHKWNSRSELIHNMTRRFTKIRCQANVAKCTIHDLRRSAITNWAHQLPIQVVQTLAGHADIKTTRKYYLTVRPEDFVSASNALRHITMHIPDD